MDIRPILSTLLRHKTAASLIVVEIALTCAIICNALFLISDRLAEVRQPSGIAEEELVRVQVEGIGSDPDEVARTRSDLATLRALPGVKNATVMNQMPFTRSSWNTGVRLSLEQQRSTLLASIYLGDDQMLETLGVQLVAGRTFNPEEYIEYNDAQSADYEGGMPAVIITRSMAQRLFPGEDPIGRTIYAWGDLPIPVVGVIDRLIRPAGVGGPEAAHYSMIFPVRPHYAVSGEYLIRTTPERRQEVLEAAVRTLRAGGNDRIVEDEDTGTIEDMRREYFQAPRSMAWLLAIVCVALLLITALGIIGLASFWVQQRTKQIGIRRALGATSGQILRYFQTENFLLATIGIGLGMLLAFAINQVLMGRYELARLPLYYLPTGAVLLWLLGQLAVYAPARRAASIPPATATRSV
ncbi:ABC transporter permease [Pseudoxanthomonas suwonensis]|uniref:ABC transporter permease n=1 Tax=Pseudoxanthomonas suwonensis TaxID=314722 RepID=UPI00138F6C62|nr:FtsX-like permease family protein [Pseudoxanthomonas suwonensis]KAF1704419.1 ABC transporter permease [Pseudoxanthomonas suwonensis]